MLPTAYKREFLRKLWRASAGGISLADALNAASDAAQAGITPGGMVVIGTSSSGQSVSFSTPDGPITPAGFVALMDELQTAYEDADDGAEDAEIYADIMAGLRPIKGYTSDFTQLCK